MGCDEPAAVDTVTARRSGMRRLRRSSPRAVQAWSGGLGTSVLSGPRGASARPDFEARAAVILDLYLIADNGSDHRGQAAAGRLRDAHPNAIMIHTPVHASWVNQVEIVFSVIEKKVLTPGDFPGLGTLSHALLAFRAPLQPHRPAVQLEVHRRRPDRTPPPHQPARAIGRRPASHRVPGSLIATPDEFTELPTKFHT